MKRRPCRLLAGFWSERGVRKSEQERNARRLPKVQAALQAALATASSRDTGSLGKSAPQQSW